MTLAKSQHTPANTHPISCEVTKWTITFIEVIDCLASQSNHMGYHNDRFFSLINKRSEKNGETGNRGPRSSRYFISFTSIQFNSLPVNPPAEGKWGGR